MSSSKPEVLVSPVHTRELPLSKSRLSRPRIEPYHHGPIGDLLKRAYYKYKHNTAYMFHETNEEITFGTLYQEATQFAAGLLELGLGSGERIAILSGNSLRWLITFWGGAIAGLTVVPIDIMTNANDLAKGLEKIGASALVTAAAWGRDDLYLKIMSICPGIEKLPKGVFKCDKLPELRNIIFMDDRKRPGTLTWKDVNLLGTNRSAKVDVEVNLDHPAMLLFTSGTTGHAKAVKISHFSLTNTIFERKKNPDSEDISVSLIEAPFFGVMFIGSGLIYPVVHGETICVASGYRDPIKICEAIEKYQVTHLNCGTLSLMALLDNKVKFNFASLIDIVVAGMPVAYVLCKKVESALPNVKVRHMYGLTETSLIALGNIDDTEEMRFANEGIPAVGVEVKITNDKDEIVDINELGEIKIKSELITKGYWNDIENTKKMVSEDGWLNTEDFGHMDINGYITVLGRCKDMIKNEKLKVNIIPSQVEAALWTNPKVYESSVFGIYDKARSMESVAAAIILFPGRESSEAEIIHFLKAIISEYKIPDFVFFVKEFPKTATGKVKVNVLRAMLLNTEQLTLSPVKLFMCWENCSCVIL